MSLKEEIDKPQNFSIIMQGGINYSNIVYISNICRTWRKLFPFSQIINVISSSDCINLLKNQNDLRLLNEFSNKREIVSAFNTILDLCDDVIVSENHTPLPKMKNDSPGANNINLMIAAAKTGLKKAKNKYTLRIRNDLFFCDRNFIDFYEEKIKSPRGSWSILKERVLISEIFTLNPLTIAKMPFHYSDWFHFGLTEDIKKIWDPVDFYPFEYAVWYRHRNHNIDSNNVEKRFYTRFAPEQWISFPFIKKQFPELSLDFHNDKTSLIDSIFTLYDNFIVNDLYSTHTYIEKYQNIINNMSNYTRIECFSQSFLEKIIGLPHKKIQDLILKNKYCTPSKIKIGRIFYNKKLKRIINYLKSDL